MFSDIIGYENTVTELKKIKHYFQNEAAYRANGIKPYTALMLYGDPGTGKTFMCEQFLNEVRSIRKIYRIEGSGTPDGISARISSAFDNAITSAKSENRGSVIFIDDMDKLFKSKDFNAGSMIQAKMEDCKDLPIFILATANNICIIDNSLMRSGRFGKMIEIRVATAKDAKEIVKKFIGDVNLDQISIDTVSELLTGCTTAAIEEIIKECKLNSMYKNIESNNSNSPITISRSDIAYAFKKVIYGTTSEDYVPSKKMDSELNIVAVHEAGHAALSIMNGLMPTFVSIDPNCSYGVTCLYAGFEKPSNSTQYMERHAEIAFAGKIAVRELLGVDDTGCGRDINVAARSVQYIVSELMAYDYTKLPQRSAYGNDVREESDILTEVKLSQIRAETTRKVLKNSDFIRAIADALIEKENLFSDDLIKICNKFGISIDDVEFIHNAYNGNTHTLEPVSCSDTGEW